jgi:RNA polymerase-binding transcription factor DksA
MKKITRTPERIFVEGETIETIDGLENCQMVLVERKDALKKAIKAAKKAKSVNKFELCCVCTEFVPVSNLNANGVCRCCQL